MGDNKVTFDNSNKDSFDQLRDRIYVLMLPKNISKMVWKDIIDLHTDSINAFVQQGSMERYYERRLVDILDIISEHCIDEKPKDFEFKYKFYRRDISENDD